MPKLCTMFAFDGVDDPNLLHCTHKYFGESTDRATVIRELEAFFAQQPFQPFRGRFTTLAHFGEDESYRVLLPDSTEPFLPALRGRLDAITPDQFPEYRPHVTVGRNTDEIDMPIRDYVLMEDHVKVWSAVEHAMALEAECRARISLPGAGVLPQLTARRMKEGARK
jgi:2'-5' RNA ligase